MERCSWGLQPYRYLEHGPVRLTYPEASYDASPIPWETGAGNHLGANGTFGGPAMGTVDAHQRRRGQSLRPGSPRHPPPDFKRLRPCNEARYNAPVRQP